MKAASQDIAACKSSPLEARAQMVAEMASKLVKGTEKTSAQETHRRLLTES